MKIDVWEGIILTFTRKNHDINSLVILELKYSFPLHGNCKAQNIQFGLYTENVTEMTDTSFPFFQRIFAFLHFSIICLEASELQRTRSF